uniref:Uncharacterized protein n=1 Tax=Meloidogyne enterolobii TaxID=390850 RepID=A0A6V7UZ75_MELEN|nr:unnamed protein product [Meloidogyne enterolobii]
MNKTIQRDCLKILKKCVNAIKKGYKNLQLNAIQPFIHQINLEYLLSFT